jgi:predicted dienelactone hydrolase
VSTPLETLRAFGVALGLLVGVGAVSSGCEGVVGPPTTSGTSDDRVVAITSPTITSPTVAPTAASTVASTVMPTVPTVPSTMVEIGPSGAAFRWVKVDTGELTYLDVSGATRSIRVQIRRPQESSPAKDAGGLPVMVWSHGGSDGKESVAVVGDDWGRAFNEAGYVFVAIAHQGRDLESRHGLCEAIGVTSCDTFLYLNWDRPADVSIVFDWLERMVDDHGESFDLDRLAYGGHSAGSVSVLTLAGMTPQVPGELVPSSDARPKVFLAAAPPGVVKYGFDERSFAAIDRPVVMLSGVGDSTNGTEGIERRATFDLMPAGVHRLVWVDDPIAKHTTFDLDRDACMRAGGSTARCREIAAGLARAGVAFVTAALSDDDMNTFVGPALPASIEWLDGGVLG